MSIMLPFPTAEKAHTWRRNVKDLSPFFRFLLVVVFVFFLTIVIVGIVKS